MKQIIVLIATVILGVSLAGVVTNMGDGVGEISTSTNGLIQEVLVTDGAIDRLTK